MQQSRRFANPPPGSGVSRKYTTVNDPERAQENEFPVVPFAPDRYDTIASIKHSVGSDKNDAFGKKWMVPFTDTDAQYMLRQQAQVANANYERWLWKQYDVTNPAEAWIFQQIAPEQFEKRKQLILYQQNLATRYAMLRLYGVKTEEDLMLKYLVETRQVELPKGPIWAPQKWMAAQAGYDTVAEYLTADGEKSWRARYRRGMFSAMKYADQDGVGKYPGANRADALGYSNTNIDNQLFVGSDVDLDKQPYADYGGVPDWARDAEEYTGKNRGFGINLYKGGAPPKVVAPKVAPKVAIVEEGGDFEAE